MEGRRQRTQLTSLFSLLHEGPGPRGVPDDPRSRRASLLGIPSTTGQAQRLQFPSSKFPRLVKHRSAENPDT